MKRKRKGVVTKQAKESLDSVYETLGVEYNFNSETGDVDDKIEKQYFGRCFFFSSTSYFISFLIFDLQSI